MASEPLPIPSKYKQSAGQASHEDTAQVLVKHYLGEQYISHQPRSLEAIFKNGNQARTAGAIASLSSRLLQEQAAVKIQSSFRKFRDEDKLRRTSFGKYGTEAVDLIRRFKQEGGTLKEEAFASKIRLVLNFDVNKTIIMSDKVQDGDMSFMVNSLLAECAWGRLEAGPAWVPVGRLATDRPTRDPRLMTYNSYLDSFLFPYELGRTPEAEAENTRIKSRRKDLKRIFTHPGQPGAMFRGVYDSLCEELKLPEGHSRDSQLFEGGLTHILPSFFNLLLHLDQQGRDFTVIFRTFGNDSAAVCEEMNMFCTGRHPRYPNVRMDGSTGRTDLRLQTPDSLALYHRASAHEKGTMLFVGAEESDMSKGKLEQADLEDRVKQGSGLLLKGFKNIHDYYRAQNSTKNRAFVIRDYYPFWKSRNERSNAGKLMLLDSNDTQTLKVFFDDNIGYSSAHIVDARDIATGQPLPFKEVEGKHLFKVEPLNAILDPHYYVRAIHECAVNWLKGKREDAAVYAHQNAGYRIFLTDSSSIDGKRHTHTSLPPVINTSRRARDLWSVLRTKVLAVVRVQQALQDLD